MHAGGRPSQRDRPELGQRIAEAREKMGVSQLELAQTLGTTQQQIVKWEREVSAIRSDSLAKIATALTVSSDELLGLKPKKQPSARGRLQRLIQQVSSLPRRQQDRLIEQFENTLAGQQVREQQKVP